MKIAVVGAGISGLGAAWLLSKNHDVTVFESENKLGGHANTVNVDEAHNKLAIDTGFIVCNDRNYFNFLNLLKEINVEVQPTDMSFGVSIGDGDFEYAGSEKLSQLLAQPSNLLRPRFYKMIKALLRFYKETAEVDGVELSNLSLREYLQQEGYDHAFLRDHILPMAAAIWSTPKSKVGDFPLSSFLRFCQNHGLLQIGNRPQWYTVHSGSRTYVDALAKNTSAEFKVGVPVRSIDRKGTGIEINTAQNSYSFDRVLIATHADVALKLISDADDLEKDILGRFSYSGNSAVLHSDPRFMPKRKKAWASWNYVQKDESDDNNLSVTYWMNKLQSLETEKSYFVTLNPATEPHSDLVYYRKEYRHPIFDKSTLRAQKRLHELMGRRNTWYAGSYFGYGFHEDGLQSGLFAAEQMGGLKRPWYSSTMNDRIIALDEHVQFESDPLSREAAE